MIVSCSSSDALRQILREHAARLVRRSDVVVHIVVREEHRYLLDPPDAEAGALEETPQALLLREHEHPRLARLGRRRQALLGEHPAGECDPRVAPGSAPDGQGQTPTRAQDAASLVDGRLGIGHEHEAEATEDAVDRVVLERDLLGVDDPMLDVLETQLGGPPTGHLDHLRREVARDQPAVLAQERGGQVPHVSGAGRELEHGVARLRIERLHQPLADGARDLLDLRSPAFPAGRHRLPVLERGALVLRAIHRGDRRRVTVPPWR